MKIKATQPRIKAKLSYSGIHGLFGLPLACGGSVTQFFIIVNIVCDYVFYVYSYFYFIVFFVSNCGKILLDFLRPVVKVVF